MINKIYAFLNKYKIYLMIIIIIILISCLSFCMVKNNKKLLSYKSNNYSLKYDNNWKIKEQKSNYIILKHNHSKSLLKFEIIKLDNEYKYDDIDNLINEVLYDINEQNKDYKLIAKQTGLFTKYEYKGYKLLYEIENKQKFEFR